MLWLVDDAVPNKQQIQLKSHHGLAKLSTKDVIEFQSSWSFDEVDSALRLYFPDLFNYLDSLDVPINGEGDPMPQWMLCTRKQKKLLLLPQIWPDGRDLYYNKGIAKSGWRNCMIYIGTFHTTIIANTRTQ
jgi:hypothetical protein